MHRLALPLLLGALGGVVASACGPTRPPCSATTCLGCCDSAGECRSGFDSAACGSRGNLCAPCGLGQNCISGSCSQSNPGGMGGGTSGGSAAGGAAGGTAGGSAGGGAVLRCDASNCGGCCDAQAQCLPGRSALSCGSNGATCLACAGGLVCNVFGSGGRCESGSAGGGSAGGGVAGGSSGGGGSGVCSPQTCPSGCCTVSGQCESAPSAAACGQNGALCSACSSGQSCVSGQCQCTGCISLSTGRCEPGTQTALCGRAGAFCTNCGASGTVCSNQQCSSTPPSCTPTTCPSGCCNPSTGACVPTSQQSSQLCGQGSSAALCIACGPQERCDLLTTAGACVLTSSPDSGFPLFDGGFPLPGTDGGFTFCLLGIECAVGECCYPVGGLGGICARIGNANLLGGTTCGRSQQLCSTTTCQPGQVCNAQVGVCQ